MNKGVLLEYVSLSWMTVEVVASVIAGLVIGKSLSLLAFAGDSIVELLSAFTVLVYLKKSTKVPVSEFQSKRVDRIVSLLLTSLIPVIIGGIIFSYISGIKPEASLLGIVTALLATIIMPVLWIEKLHTGRESNLLPLTIDAMESATCFFMSVALLGGLLTNYLFHIAWADYIATVIILGFVGIEAKESFEVERPKTRLD